MTILELYEMLQGRLKDLRSLRQEDISDMELVVGICVLQDELQVLENAMRIQSSYQSHTINTLKLLI